MGLLEAVGGDVITSPPTISGWYASHMAQLADISFAANVNLVSGTSVAG